MHKLRWSSPSAHVTCGEHRWRELLLVRGVFQPLSCAALGEFRCSCAQIPSDAIDTHQPWQKLLFAHRCAYEQNAPCNCEGPSTHFFYGELGMGLAVRTRGNNALQQVGEEAMLPRFKVGIVALALSFGLASAPAMAQPQVGLVNVVIDDINVTVPIQAAANIAANVCGVQLAALNLVVGQQQTVPCTSGAKSGKQAQFTLIQN